MSYVHHIPGRIRVRSEAVKNSLARARQLETRLRSMNGVRDVAINLTTGSVLIHYQAGAVSGERLIEEVSGRGSIRPAGVNRPTTARRAERTVAQVVLTAAVKYGAELALERSVAALAAALL